ncbi:hypothetical protein J2W83_002404 [Pseudomonas hunanensis]|uniref:Uncharacterized protein n=1 Tax=Pseudomonas hunanensis TaxID=1247546 RepID=A0ACC6K2Y5_9PSED|nr:hypothetical protein [Pseudomonas hunanensis]
MPLSKITPAQTPPVTSRLQEAERRSRSRSTATATAGESLRSRFVYLPADLWGGWAGLRPAICVGSTGLFAGQARSYRIYADVEFDAGPVGAGLSREEARTSTPPATIENNASPDAARDFETSGDRSEGTPKRSVGPDAGASGFWLLFSKKKSDPPKGGRGQWRHHINWISPQPTSPSLPANPEEPFRYTPGRSWVRYPAVPRHNAAPKLTAYLA